MSLSYSTGAAIAAVISFATGGMLGQAAGGPELLPGWPGIFVQLGSFGVVCFVVWWLTTKHIPKLQAEFAAAIERISETYAQRLDKLVADAEAARKAHAEEQEATRKAFDTEQGRLRHDARERESAAQLRVQVLQEQMLEQVAQQRQPPQPTAPPSLQK